MGELGRASTASTAVRWARRAERLATEAVEIDQWALAAVLRTKAETWWVMAAVRMLDEVRRG